MKYYGITFRCHLSTHPGQDRFIGYGLQKEGELSDEDIATAKNELQAGVLNSGITVLEYRKHVEHTAEEWASLIKSE